MIEFFSRLFDTSGFMARWQCGEFPPAVGWLHITSDILIWGAYMAIPMIILYYLYRKPDMLFPRVGWLFAAFIFFCGTGHLIEATIFWWPNYRLDGLVKATTAIISWATVAAVAPLVPRALELPGMTTLIHDLEAEVTERRRAQSSLDERNRDLQTLLHIISHDLREPLRGIRGLSSLLASRQREKLDADGREVLDRIETSGKRLDALLRDLNQFTRAHNLVVKHDPVSLNDAADAAVERLRMAIEASGAKVTVAAGLPMVSGDADWIAQAIYNLLSNALKYSRTGACPEIEISAWSPDDGSGCEGVVVRDRGVGLDPEQSEAIFELFRRDADASVEGTGTGLAIVRAVSVRHGGTAWAEARTGGGSAFFITFAKLSSANVRADT